MYSRLRLSIHLLDIEWSPPSAVVKNDAMNFRAQVSKSLVSGLLCRYLEVELLITWCVYVLIAQLCLTLFHPMDCSLLDSSVHGVVQARILEWVAISSSRGSS